MFAKDKYPYTKTPKKKHTRREIPENKKSDLVRSGPCLEKSGECPPQKEHDSEHAI
jgi:hypothetical protein